MNTKQITKSSTPTVAVRRVMTPAAVRRIHSDNVRLKKAQKALRRMKKEMDE